MKVDFTLPLDDPATAGSHAIHARALGYDGLLTAETAHDPFLPLAIAAAAVPDMDYGTAIAVAFARSPTVLATTAWDLARLTGGRFTLGLGTQVRAHVTRRFSMEWSSPGPRLREYVEAIRAVWATWQRGDPLRFRGDFYSLTLMTPFFDPGPIPYDPPPVAIAAVGPYLSRVAGEVCDGLLVHPFHTVRYLDEVTLPNVAVGARSRDRNPEAIGLSASVMIGTGRDASELGRARRLVARQIAFYASTPAYAPVLDLHGWDMGSRLTNLSLRGAWDEMTTLVPDEMVDTVAVIAPVDELADRIRHRYGTRLSRVGLYEVEGVAPLSDADRAAVVDGLRR